MEHLGNITDGTLTLDDRQAFVTDVRNRQPGRVMLTLVRYSPKRSDRQNRMYWGAIINPAADELGYTPDELHATFRAMHLTDRTQTVPIVRSTTGLTTVEMLQYIEACVRTLAEMGHVVRMPDDWL